jgi:hypothetical protein
MTNTQSTKPTASAAQPKLARPNETGSISVQARMRIFDPVTQKTFVEGRA